MKMSNNQLKKCLDNPSECPFCKAKDIVLTDRFFITDSNKSREFFTCPVCNKYWLVEFTATFAEMLYHD